MSAGRFAEALEELIWFHHNALAEDPALSGVRLSFALAYWIELGDIYPPALAALEALRNQKAAALLLGELDADAFHDVASINAYLETSALTYRLYQQLRTAQPELANACARSALPSIVDAKDYRLAAQISPDPETMIRNESRNLNYRVMRIKHQSYSRAPVRWAYVGNHVQSIQRQLEIKSGNGEHAEAARLKELAIALIESPSLRREVEAGFIKRANHALRVDSRRHW
jgi:hypothetical protein